MKNKKYYIFLLICSIIFICKIYGDYYQMSRFKLLESLYDATSIEIIDFENGHIDLSNEEIEKFKEKALLPYNITSVKNEFRYKLDRDNAKIIFKNESEVIAIFELKELINYKEITDMIGTVYTEKYIAKYKNDYYQFRYLTNILE